MSGTTFLQIPSGHLGGIIVRFHAFSSISFDDFF